MMVEQDRYSGNYVISDIIGGYLVSEVFIGYTKDEALGIFAEKHGEVAK